ncbi:MAG: hypothetical protein AAFV19_25345, partial [Pseudomonadota bacterium]
TDFFNKIGQSGRSRPCRCSRSRPREPSFVQGAALSRRVPPQCGQTEHSLRLRERLLFRF